MIANRCIEAIRSVFEMLSPDGSRTRHRSQSIAAGGVGSGKSIRPRLRSSSSLDESVVHSCPSGDRRRLRSVRIQVRLDPALTAIWPRWRRLRTGKVGIELRELVFGMVAENLGCSTHP